MARSAVTRKPSKTLRTNNNTEAEVQKFIEGGGERVSAADDSKKYYKKSRFGIHLKAPPELIERVDQAIDSLDLPTTRAAFIYKAIEEKLERDGY